MKINMCGFGHWAGLSWNSAASLHHATFLIHGTRASQSYKYSHYLTFSSSKCKYMIISRKKNPSHPPALKLGSSALDRVYSYRYLGLLLTLSLCWTEHINDICAKAKRMVALLYRRFYKDASPQNLFQMYLVLVRPHTEYASQVWDSHLQKDIDQLECVQKFALRMCTKQWGLGYAELLNRFKVPSLRDRRDYLSLCTKYKVVHELVYFPMMCLCLGLPH